MSEPWSTNAVLASSSTATEDGPVATGASLTGATLMRTTAGLELTVPSDTV